MTVTLSPFTPSQLMADYRATPATYTDQTGVLNDAAVNSLLLDFDADTLTANGFTCKESRTNLIPNPLGVGGVPGTGTSFTDPTGWSGGEANLTRTLVGSGIENGETYTDYRFYGTTTAAGIGFLYFSTATACPASPGQYYSVSAGVKLMSAVGSLANVATLMMCMAAYNSAGSALSVDAYYGSGTSQNASMSYPTTTAKSRASYSVLVADSAVAYLRPCIRFNLNSGVTVDFTLRVYNPVLERGPFPSGRIRPPAGTIAATTRGADDLRLSLQSGWMDGASNTFVFEALVKQAAPVGQDQGIFRLDDGTEANKFVITNVGGGSSVHAQLTLGGTLVSDIVLGSYVVGQRFRVVAGYSLVAGAGVLAGIVSGGNRATSAPTVSTVPTWVRALLGRSSLNAGRFIEEGALHLNGYISEVVVAKGAVLSEDAMLYLTQMNQTMGALLTSAGVILASS